MSFCSLQILKEVQPSGPYRIGGYSFGACVATAMAEELGSELEYVVHLDSSPEAFHTTSDIYMPTALNKAQRETKALCFYAQSLADVKFTQVQT